MRSNLTSVAEGGILLSHVHQVVRLPEVSKSVGDGRLPSARHLVHPLHHPLPPVSPHDVRLRDGDPVRNFPVRQVNLRVLSTSIDTDTVCVLEV